MAMYLLSGATLAPRMEVVSSVLKLILRRHKSHHRPARRSAPTPVRTQRTTTYAWIITSSSPSDEEGRTAASPPSA
jgi:hypothetical protein